MSAILWTRPDVQQLRELTQEVLQLGEVAEREIRTIEANDQLSGEGKTRRSQEVRAQATTSLGQLEKAARRTRNKASDAISTAREVSESFDRDRLVRIDRERDAWHLVERALENGVTFDRLLDRARERDDIDTIRAIRDRGARWLEAVAGPSADGPSARRDVQALVEGAQAALEAVSPAERSAATTEREVAAVWRGFEEALNVGLAQVEGRVSPQDWIRAGYAAEHAARTSR